MPLWEHMVSFESIFLIRRVQKKLQTCVRVCACAHASLCRVCLFEERMPGIPLARRVRHQSTPTLEGAARHQVALTHYQAVRPRSSSLYTLRVSRQRPYEQSADLSCQRNSRLWVTVWLLDPPLGDLCIHATHTQAGFLHTRSCPPKAQRFSCSCLHSCQTVWTHSHDEFTPPCGYLCVRGISIAVEFASRHRHRGPNFWYLSVWFRLQRECFFFFKVLHLKYCVCQPVT